MATSSRPKQTSPQIPEQHSRFEYVPKPFNEIVITLLEYIEKDQTLLTHSIDTDQVLVREIAHYIQQRAYDRGHSVIIAQSPERDVGRIASSYIAEPQPDDILYSLAQYLDTLAQPDFSQSRIALNELQELNMKKVALKQQLAQILNEIPESQKNFLEFVRYIKDVAEQGNPLLLKYEQQIYDAELLAQLYTIQNATM
jgi:hypothetical protein